MDDTDGIHGTNGSRGPTAAETRAVKAMFEALMSKRGSDDAVCLSGRLGAHQITIDGEIDMLMIVRAVVRSLTPPTPEMDKAMTSAAGFGEEPEDIFRAGIDAASPEIKP